MSSSNFAGLMAAHAEARPDQPALHMKAGGAWRSLTLRELDQASDAVAWGLTEVAGIQRGERVSMLVKPSFEFFTVGFALYKIGAIPVLIDPGMGREGFLSCVAQIQPTALIAIPLGQVIASLFSSPFSAVDKRVTVGWGSWLWGGHSLSACTLEDRGRFPMAVVDPDEEAGVLFTSGSTGPAKGVRYTHGMFRTQTRLIGELYGIQPGQVDVPCFLPFAMFSVSLGMEVALPDIDFSRPATAEPDDVVEAIRRFEADQLVGSPAVMARLADELPRTGITLETLQRVLTFGAPIPPALHERFGRFLPEDAAVHTPYGATEALPVASVASSEIIEETGARTLEGEGTCVGRPVPGLELAIIPITDDPIPSWDEALRLEPGVVGEICVKGDQVSAEYKERPDANAAAKIRDGEGLWHRMGDLGRIDEGGRIWFLGRKSHRVRLSDGRELYPVALEAIFNHHPAVRRSAVVGVSGEAALVVELEDGHRGGEALRAELLELACQRPLTAPVRRVLFHPGLPVDRRHNAKIHRLELAAWAEEVR